MQSAKQIKKFSRFANLIKRIFIKFVPAFFDNVEIFTIFSGNIKLNNLCRRLAQSLPVLKAMKIFDFLVIYLTCGAPLGVFYFLQNRKTQIGVRLWLKTFFTFIFWLPFGFRLLMKKKANKKFSFSGIFFFKNDRIEDNIFLFQKSFEAVLETSHLPISIFEFREVFDRYVGLTFAEDCENAKIQESEKEIFRADHNKNIRIGAICLNRRNLKRLAFHQIQARRDFFQIINQLAAFTSDRNGFVKSAACFFRLLNDCEARLLLEKESFGDLPNEKSFVKNRSENYLWNTEILKQSPAKTKLIHLPNSLAKTNASVKD